jgi:hypothetical protein
LRRILGPTKENNTWRIRYNNELYKKFDEPSISNIIKLKRLQWAGHVQRMDGRRIPKWILESNFIGKRPVGKPRKRGINAVEIDSKEILKVRNWKRESQERQIWRRHLKEANTRLRAVAPQKKKQEGKGMEVKKFQPTAVFFTITTHLAKISASGSNRILIVVYIFESRQTKFVRAFRKS